MNKSSIKHILLIASITFCIPTSCMMNTLRDYADRFKSWSYKTFFEKKPVYEAGVKTIDTAASNLSTAAVRLSPITFSRLTPEAKKRRLQLQQQLIDRRLKTIENNLKQEEKNTMNDIFNDYGVTQEQRHAIIAKIDEEKQFEKEYMSRPHKKAIGNVELQPEHEYIYNVAGIHPQGVKLTKIEQKDGKGRAVFMVTEPSLNPSKKLTVLAPPEIELSPSLSPLSELGTLAHEVGHHASHHGPTLNVLANSLVEITGATPEQIGNDKNFNKLITIFERQAEILHKNKPIAGLMRGHRKYRGYYPDQLFLGHYAQLAEIDELHKLKKKLEDYKPEPMQPKIDTLSTMKFNAPKQPAQSPQRQFPQKPKVVPVDRISATAQQLATE